MTTAREQTARLADLLRREHHALADFLVALAAFDEARGWVELGYSSLFYFLVRELGLPKGPAYYRMTAAGLIQKYPELVPAAAPPVRTVVTAIRPPTVQAAVVPVTARAVLPEEPAPVSPAVGMADPCEDIATLVPASPRPQATKVEPLTADESRLHVTVSRGLLEKLSAARDALSHSHPGASDSAILEVGLDLILARHAKRRGIGAKPRGTTSKKATAAPARPTRRSRHVPADVWRAVWARDRGCCAWPLDNGGVCGSTWQLELDHVKGWALGAGTTVDECRLLCRRHRDVSARRLYGDDLMNDYTQPKGGKCSEPVAEYGAHFRPPRLISG